MCTWDRYADLIAHTPPATAGSARALQRFDVGTLQQGARADLVILDAPSHVHLAYRPGVPLVRTVIAAGGVVRG